MFVRIRLPIGQPHPAVLVIDRAVQSDQGMKYVYIVDQNNTVQYRRVTTGSLQDDGLRVITQGLNPGERVVVAGLQQVHSHDQIVPEQVSMPSLNQPSEEDASQGDEDSGAAKAAPAKSKAGP
jgi:multidrug efflux system membrane fusion protein